MVDFNKYGCVFEYQQPRCIMWGGGSTNLRCHWHRFANKKELWESRNTFDEWLKEFQEMYPIGPSSAMVWHIDNETIWAAVRGQISDTALRDAVHKFRQSFPYPNAPWIKEDKKIQTIKNGQELTDKLAKSFEDDLPF